MIKQVLHKSFSVLLAVLVLFSTVSFTFEKHFCGNVLVDVSLFAEAEKCDMGTSEISNEGLAEKSCCKDEISVVQGQDDLQLSSFDDLNFSQQLFISTFNHAFVNLFEGLQEQIIPHKQYSPPNLVADIQVLVQVFII